MSMRLVSARVGKVPRPSSLQRWLGRLASNLLTAALCPVTMVPFAAEAATPNPVSLEALQAPARIVVDRWGVPHIYAENTHDAFLLQGYNAARDRLWQIDLWRKRGLGQLSKSFGSRYLAQDRAARLFLFRGNMNAEWASYPSHAKDAAAAFVSGVNAYVAAVNSGRAPLPIEFQITDSRPEPWDLDDIVRIRSHALVSNVRSEIARAAVTCATDIETTRLMRKVEPVHRLRIPVGLETCGIPEEVAATYALATAPVTFSNAAASAAHTDTFMPPEGSNNWVIAPTRTSTGRPILANDPHRALSLPSLRYMVHLEAPGLSLIGGGEPSLPGIALGHNGNIAWGLTIFPSDQEDLYVYELAGGAAEAYRYGTGWEPIRKLVETIEIKGQPSRHVELRFTRHGPILALDRAARRAFAVRSVWSDPGTSAYFGSAWLWNAHAWEDLLQARDRWGTPPLNLVFADASGNIGWAAAARIPVRPNWDGMLPVPGDGRYEWSGFLRGSALPSRLNPAQGWLATANEMNLPDDYPSEGQTISFEWVDRARIERIEHILSKNNRASIEAMAALQTDGRNRLAARLIDLVRPLAKRGKNDNLDLIATWDGDERADSAAAALFHVWTRTLMDATLTAIAPPAARPHLGPPSLDVVVSRLEEPNSAFGPDPHRARDKILVDSLDKAGQVATRLLGPDRKRWEWGRLHVILLQADVWPLADPRSKELPSLGPFPVKGSVWSPIAFGYGTGDFQAVTGASTRIVIDVGNWDGSRFVNGPGQSGVPSSAHYNDLLSAWLAGETVPLLFSAAAVERNASQTFRFMPAQR